MTVAIWREFRVRVKVMAPSIDEAEGCYKEIKADIRQAVNKKVLGRRYHVEVLAGPVRDEPVDP